MIRYPFGDQQTNSPDDRPDRPLGVTLLTIWNGITLGLMPILFSGISLTTADQSALTPAVCLSLIFSVGLVFTAIGTWRGHDPSRMGMLALLILYYALKGFNSSLPLFMGTADQDQRLVVYGLLLRYLVWTSLNVWYFLRPGTIAFYRKRKS